MMPEVDGVELARMIKSDPALSAMTLILVSSVGSKAAFAKRLTGLEVAAWLTKPVPQSTLYNTLAKALGRTAESQPRVPPDGAGPNRTQPSPLPCARALRVLVAEDNPINQKLARLTLKKFGADVTTVANGREAVEAVSRFPYDVVFMDCQMPEMDGYEASREIRRREGPGRHTRILALTAHALEADRDKCLDAGMDAYITKPLDSKALETILREIAASLAPLDEADASPKNGAKPPQ